MDARLDGARFGVLVVGYFAWREYGDVIKHRLNDEKLGLHIGR